MKAHVSVPDAIEAGYTWEKLVFGCCGRDFPLFPAKIHWKQAVREVMGQQTDWYDWDPRAPKTGIARKLLSLVQNHFLGNRDQLAFYCSLGTSLDFYDSTDGFFLAGRYLVSIDLSIGMKPHRHRSLVCVRKSEYLDHPESVGELIASIFNRGLARPIT